MRLVFVTASSVKLQHKRLQSPSQEKRISSPAGGAERVRELATCERTPL